ncbi:DNA methyltransferase [Bradyrhizobium sp. SZCCHNR2028]|uniref:DNA methyltransferase n=1 Tax=Bradyrhizobium sp. SZCCHNR2028 TaxID=3057382 RepID=UPI0028F064A2|nr:DNA methyltransferase [Bradyrhizobium sp. SZCCHNR2028]
MSPLTKTVYFPDYPKSASGRSGLTVPFPEGCNGAFNRVANLSSYSIRNLTGYDSFARLEIDAQAANTSTATFLREKLLNSVKLVREFDDRDYRAPLQATFQGGKGSPLHDWYPYLEGYSPDFVNAIIDKYAPAAERILDPFCGSGTTAITSALRGIAAYYSEVNPVCRFIITSKFAALRLPYAERARIARELESLAETIERGLRSSLEDDQLRTAFRCAFGDSEFFDAKSFSNVLRLRTIADQLAIEDAALAQFFVVAVLRSLVQGSLLVRRGDLRFKTATELKRNPPRLLHEVCASLRLVASDLHDAPHCERAADLVCNDARALAMHIREPVDAIVTSPPYLNGTNYFRNTKIELWFLRQLASKEGLRALRDAAITSGINDVTGKKANGSFNVAPSATLVKVLAAFSGNVYDPRIPLMVRSYFGEMLGVLKNFHDVLRPNGIAAIDLGDSCYGSVWVPTDQILSELMTACGFVQVDRIVLRERQSRDGRKLGQTLQIFKKKEHLPTDRKVVRSNTVNSPALKGWKQFRSNLLHQQGAMASRNWGDPLHSLCSYQGKLKPSIAHRLVEALIPTGTGARILDPFAGVGTIPFEAQLKGHTGLAFDISPAAIAICRAKIEPIIPSKVSSILRKLAVSLDHADATDVNREQLDKIRFNGPLSEYFHPKTLAQIVAARSFFKEHAPNDGSTALVFAAMLHILHGNRPYALSRRSHPITPFAPTGPREYRPVMERLRTKVEKSLLSIAQERSRSGRAYFQDATQPWPSDVANLDAIITSPPFFDSTRFHTANWMRLWFAGWEAADFKEKPTLFVDERQKQTFDVYRAVFQQSCERLKPGGFFLIHLGKSRKCDMAAALENVAASYLEHVDLFTESVEHCESHGLRDKGTVTHHQYLLLRRP